MIAYCYDENKIFTGTEKAQESPLEPGIFLLPAQSTFVAIPQFNKENERLVWNENEWIIENIPEQISQDIEQIISNNILTPEQEQVLKNSIIEKLKNIGFTDEELILIFGAY